MNRQIQRVKVIMITLAARESSINSSTSLHSALALIVTVLLLLQKLNRESGEVTKEQEEVLRGT